MTKRKTDRAPQPPVQPVSGPRPLPLLMAMETSTLLGSLAALTSSSSGWPPLKPDQVRPELAARASELQKALANVPADAFYRAATAEARKRLDAFTQGVRLYRLADRPPRPTEPKTVWHDGSPRLLDYGDTPQAIDSNGPISILIPSPAQRSWLFDADAEHSLLRDLAARGLRPLAVDWGMPEGTEVSQNLSDLIAGRLGRALDAAVGLNGGPVALIGHGHGGVLALGLAHLHPHDVSALALLATPWDFHAGREDLRDMADMLPRFEDAVVQTGVLPVDMTRAMVAALAPRATPARFRRYADLIPSSRQAGRFVIAEDWRNDGVALPGPAALEAVRDWYLVNAPARGDWIVGNEPLRPADVTCPTLVVIADDDPAAPAASQQALADALPAAEIHHLAGDEADIVLGDGEKPPVSKLLADWLRARKAQPA